MLPGDLYVRQMLVQHHRSALSPDSGVPRLARRGAAARRDVERRRGGTLRLLVLRLRPAHGGS